jgi:zinc transporter, ZIP family
MTELPNVLSYTLIPVAAMLIGSTFAALRPPSDRLRSNTQHFAAGVVFAALSGEVLPQLMQGHPAPIDVAIGFALGVGTMLGVRHLTEGTGTANAEGSDTPQSLVMAAGVDLFIDGLLVGLGFVAGQKVGLLLTVALTTEILFLGLATAGALLKAGASRARVTMTAAALMVPLLVGAGIGATLLSGLSQPYFDAVLAFGVAALLYLVTEELLTEAHEVPEVAFSTAMFFLGFLVILLTEMFVG